MRFMRQVDEVRPAFVTVRVRWETFSGGLLVGLGIVNVLQDAHSNGYLDAFPLAAEFTSVGQDDVGLHYWTNTIQLMYENVKVA